MKHAPKVYGISAPGPRMTKGAALMLAIVLSVPVFVGLSLLGWALH